MARIVCIWELGEGLGHLGMFSQVTAELARQGHDVYFVTKDLSKIEAFVWDERVKLLQAPVWHSRQGKLDVTYNFAGILLIKGFRLVSTLRPLVQAWLQLFDMLAPDLIIFDHAPTALLAARKLSVARIILSNCYVTPPSGTPPVSLKSGAPALPELMEKIELHAVGVINEIASHFKIPGVKNVSDLYTANRYFFYTYSELDFYKDSRTSGEFIGPFYPSKTDLTPHWGLSSVKVFVYLKYGKEHVEQVLGELAAMGANIVCFYAGASPELCQKYQSPKFQISNRPFDMSAVFREANVFVCHAGLGVVSSCLQTGKPMILLPTQPEQAYTAAIVENMKLGVVITNGTPQETVSQKIRNFFSSSSFTEKAKSFAYEHQEQKPEKALRIIREACSTLLNSPPDIANHL